jgi:hypothetical protein
VARPLGISFDIRLKLIKSAHFGITGRTLLQASVTERQSHSRLLLGDCVPEYRAFPVKNFHIAGPAHIIECDTDQEAIEWAKQFAVGHGIELWDGGRLVSDLKSTNPGK